MGTTEPIHESDPDQAPDSDFEPGELHHLVPGNTGRMLDTRRTPVRVGLVDPDLGTFEVEVLAFEDRGARWLMGAGRVSRFQFPLDAPRADVANVSALATAVDRFSRPLDIPIDPRARVRTRAQRACRDERPPPSAGGSRRAAVGVRRNRRALPGVPDRPSVGATSAGARQSRARDRIGG